jgi:hypothetical protein
VQPYKLLSGCHFQDCIGREKIMPNIQAALNRAKELHAADPEAVDPVAAPEDSL